MDWSAVQEQMEARAKLAATALGGLGILVGLLLLRRPGPRWVAYTLVADGGLIVATGRGVLTRAYAAITNSTSSGETPALKEA